MLWGRSGTFWDALGRSGTLWGRSGTLWDTLGRSGDAVDTWEGSGMIHDGGDDDDDSSSSISIYTNS